MAIIGLAFLGISACVSGGGSPVHASPIATVSVPPAPKFHGPYAAELAEQWKDPRNPQFVRSVIADGKITDQEWAEVAPRLKSCLRGKGLNFTGFLPDGSYHVDNNPNMSGQETNDALPGCEFASGEMAIGLLRHAMATNPDNIPVSQVMAQCLIRLGVVGPDYTPADYDRDVPTESFPYLDRSTGEKNFWKCNENPTVGLNG